MDNKIVLKIHLAIYSSGFYIQRINDYRKEIQQELIEYLRKMGVGFRFDDESLLVSDSNEHKILFLLESLSIRYQVILV